MVASLISPLAARAARTAAYRDHSRAEAQHDAGLIRRFNDGDESAFSQIVGRYRAKMHRVALGLLKNHADAEEITQDTFIRAHRGLVRFRGDSSLATWLHCITLNLARNRYWYFSRRKRHVTQSLDSLVGEGTSTFAELIACDGAGPVRETDSREFSSLVTECMQQLNAAQQQILRLRNVQQHSYTEIARTLGITNGTVKSRIARARETLRGLLVRIYKEKMPAGDVGESPWFGTNRAEGLVAKRGS